MSTCRAARLAAEEKQAREAALRSEAALPPLPELQTDLNAEADTANSKVTGA
jgi:hypothetical protein